VKTNDALPHLNVKGRIEAHLQMTFGVLVEDPLEGLLKDGSLKRVGQDHEATGVVAERLHFEQANLIQAARKEVDGMSIVGCSFGQTFVELCFRGNGVSSEFAQHDAFRTFAALLKYLTLSLSMS
jgi:hypothetical protein